MCLSGVRILMGFFLQVYGPHIGALYTRASSLSSSLNSLAHHFLKVDDRSYKLQPGGPGYELVYGLTAISEYLRKLSPARSLTDTFEQFGRYEQSLIIPLLTFLKSKEARGVRIVGEERAGMTRVPTISFVVVGDRAIKSRDVVKAFDKKGKVRRRRSVSLCDPHPHQSPRLRSASATATSTRIPSWNTWSPSLIWKMVLFASRSSTTTPWRRCRPSLRFSKKYWPKCITSPLNYKAQTTNIHECQSVLLFSARVIIIRVESQV